MAEQRERSEWARTSSLLALIANVHRDPKKTRAFKPGDFDPFTKRTGRSDMMELKTLFTGAKPPAARTTSDDRSEH
ncbi:MAG: hypothetical protein EA376_01205 [Phycisphaeraceae bacterium]|nr:MAG: hypothetical protein EA376_01205 [Phycisphaeraceae bacterium]